MNWDAVNQMTLNWVDWVIISVLFISIVVSLWRGFVREALSLGAWIVAFIAAGLLGDNLAALLDGVIANDTGRLIAAYVLIFVGVLLLGSLLNAIMGRFIRWSGLSLLDRLLGTVFGFARALIIILVAVFVVRELVPMENQRALLESELVPHLEVLAHWCRETFNALNNTATAGVTA